MGLNVNALRLKANIVQSTILHKNSPIFIEFCAKHNCYTLTHSGYEFS